MTHHEIDDDGFICLVAPDGYHGFVDEDWSLDDLLAKFVTLMNERRLFVAFAGPDAAGGTLTLATAIPDDALRHASGVIEVGESGLWLTDYTQLTMAAQYDDESPIASYASRLPVTAGLHRVSVAEVAENAYVLVVEPATMPAPEHTRVPWFID